MQKLGLNEEASEPKKTFWRRQFQKEATLSQKNFDWHFGVIFPVICFLFDPLVFRSGFGEPLLGAFKPFAYTLSFVSIMAMTAWLIWREKLKWLNGILAGLFLVGGIISLGVGIVLAPLSFVGLIMLIGILGFTPLFSAFVYLRNSYRAYQSAKSSLEKGVLVNSLVLTAILSIVVPTVANVQIKKSMDGIINGDAQTIRAETQSLRYVVPLVNLNVFLNRYNSSSNSDEEKKALAEAYLQLTGEDIETKSRRMMD